MEKDLVVVLSVEDPIDWTNDEGQRYVHKKVHYIMAEANEGGYMPQIEKLKPEDYDTVLMPGLYYMTSVKVPGKKGSPIHKYKFEFLDAVFIDSLFIIKSKKAV